MIVRLGSLPKSSLSWLRRRQLRKLGNSVGLQTRNADEAGQTENQQGGGKSPRANRRLAILCTAKTIQTAIGSGVLVRCCWPPNRTPAVGEYDAAELELIRSLIFILCAIAALALLIATIGAVFAMITGHVRWIELAWLSIAASLLAIVVSETWPWDRKGER
jgi:hypothetical protein